MFFFLYGSSTHSHLIVCVHCFLYFIHPQRFFVVIPVHIWHVFDLFCAFVLKWTYFFFYFCREISSTITNSHPHLFVLLFFFTNCINIFPSNRLLLLKWYPKKRMRYLSSLIFFFVHIFFFRHFIVYGVRKRKSTKNA